VALSEAAQTFSLLGKTDLAKGLREEHAWLFGLGHQLSSEDESKVYPTGAASEGAVAREALQAADRREFLRATAKLEELLAASPGEGSIAGALARLWLRLFRFHDALRVAALCLSKGGESPDLLRAQADAEHALGRLKEERAALRRASAIISSGGGGAEDQGKALEHYARAGLLELEPGGSLEESERCFAMARAAAPGDWRPVFGRGRVAIERGDPAKALELFAAALELAREDAAGVAALRRWSAVAKGLAGDLTAAAREIMSLVKESPGDLENFLAFERIFGSKQGEPQVARVMELKKSLEEKSSAMDGALRSVAAASFPASGPGYLALGKMFLGEGSREKALDCLFLAAELEPSSAESLRLAQGALTGPRATFLRLRALRRLLERQPADEEALESAARLYLDLGLRLDVAESLALRLQALKPGEASARLLREIGERKRAH
jgi:tetratricopeptide (TPR) repeat protein